MNNNVNNAVKIENSGNQQNNLNFHTSSNNLNSQGFIGNNNTNSYESDNGDEQEFGNNLEDILIL